MRFPALTVVLATAALLASCSSETPKPEAPATSTSPSGHGALAQCLSEHGVPAAPGPSAGPPPGVDQTTWRDAMQACSTLGPGPAS
ncbi:MAG: hypothetical protein ACRDUX_00715 [Mycobacterium sp.]